MAITNVSFEVKEGHGTTSPQTEVETGSGGVDLAMWGSSTVDRFSVISHVPFLAITNNSAYELFTAGAVLSPQHTRFEVKEQKSPTANPDGEVGSGGSQLSLWELSTKDRYALLSSQPLDFWSNESSTPVFQSAEILHPQHSRFEADEQHETTLNEAPTNDSTSPDMDLWGLLMDDKFETVSNVPVTEWTNESIYEIFTSSGPLSPVYESFEVRENKDVGYAVTGEARDQNGDPLDGDGVLLNSNNEIVVARKVRGKFVLGAPPAPGVESGPDDGTIPTYRLYFEPKSDGTAVIEEDANNTNLYAFQYSAVTVRVLDADGEPLTDETVRTDDSTFKTDSQGRAQIVSPGGVSLSLKALEGSSVRNIDPAQTSDVQFQYGGVTVSVADPNDGEPMVGVPTTVRGDNYYTDDVGEVDLTKLPLGEHSVVVMDYFSDTFSVDYEGHKPSVSFGKSGALEGDGGADVEGLTIRVADAETGRTIVDTTATIPTIGVRSATDARGRASVLHDLLNQELTVRVAEDDPRYVGESVTVDPTGGQSYFEVDVRPETPTVNM